MQRDRAGFRSIPLYLAALACALACVMALLAACARVPDAEAIRAAIGSMGAAAEKRDAGAFMAYIADDFIGNNELDRAQLMDMLRGQWLVAQAVGASVGSIDVNVQGDRATAAFDARVTDSSGRWILDRATTLHFTTAWRRTGGKWLCYNAKWKQD